MINWRNAKSHLSSMTIEEKRRLYKCRDRFKTEVHIVDWGAYVRTDEARAKLASYWAGKDSHKKDAKTQTDEGQSESPVTSDNDGLVEKTNTDIDKEDDHSGNVKDSKQSNVLNEKTSIDENKAGNNSVAREDIEKTNVAGDSKAAEKPTTTGDTAKMELKVMSKATSTEKMEVADAGETEAGDKPTTSGVSAKSGLDVMSKATNTEKMEVLDAGDTKAGDKPTTSGVSAEIVLKIMNKATSTEKMEVVDAGESKAGDKPTTTGDTAKMELKVMSKATNTEKMEVVDAGETKASDKTTTTGDTAKSRLEVMNKATNTDEGESEKVAEGEAASSDTKKKFPRNDVLNGKISLFTGDITCLEIDAIVNAANEELYCGGGVDNAIHTAAGYAFLRSECDELNGCDTGDAKITSGYKLPAKYVIHAVGPKGEYPDLLRSCYNRSMDLLKEHELETIAFPCISTGIYGYPNENAAKVALETIRKWLDEDEYSAKVRRVIFCLFLQSDIKIYHELMPKYFPFE